MDEDPVPSGVSSNGAEASLAQRFFGLTPIRLMFGLAVLFGILGLLLLLDRAGGDASALGALDDQPPEIGELAPQFALRNHDGQVVQLSDFEGQVVWINFWASWCGPCRRELPDIEHLAAEFKDDGLVVLTLNQGESGSTATNFLEALELDLPILLDSDEDVANQYRLIGLPNNYFIDEDGILRAFQHGFLTEGQMREKLAAAGIG
jgi:peroxiredoxin